MVILWGWVFLMGEVPLQAYTGTCPAGRLCSFQVVRPLYRGASLIRNSTPLRPYSRPVPRVIWWS